MASPTSPTHGKKGAIWQTRKNGFIGDGLNDLTWGLVATNAASAYYEVEIDALGTPDTFQWRKDGGAWTPGVSITGASQTLDEGQTITFAATTGHILGDKWVIGNLVSEACTEVGATAQVTDSVKQILNPNNPPVFTDSGGETVLDIDYAAGIATFSGNVAIVTVSGNNGFIPVSATAKVGYVMDWNLDTTTTFDDITPMGDDWEDQIAGLSSAAGSVNAFYIGSRTFFESLEEGSGNGQGYFLLQLFNYDPDQDGTGDHFTVWVNFTNVNANAPLREVVKEGANFKVKGLPLFVANV